MQLHCTRIQNFLSVPDATIDYRGAGTTLVVGKNGAGKSALFVEPLLWLFYGSLNRTDLSTFSNRVRRRYHGKEVEGPVQVEAWFSQDGHEYYAKRSLDDGYEISQDGLAITPYRKKDDGVAAMRNVIRLPENLFRSIAVMGQGFRERFSGFKDSSRSEIIEDFLGAAVYEEAQVRTDSYLPIVATAIAGVTAQLVAARSSVQTSQQQIVEAQARHASQVQANAAVRASLEAECQSLGEQIGISQSSLAELQRQVAVLDTHIAEIDQSRVKHNATIEALQNAIGGHTATLTALQNKLAKLTHLSGTCPECYQPVDNAIVNRETEQKYAERATEQEKLNAANAQLQTVRGLVSDCERELGAMRTQRHNVMSAQVGHQTAITAANGRYQAIQAELSRLSDAEFDAAAFVRMIEQRLAAEQANVATLETTLANYEYHKTYLTWWSEGFSIRGLRSARLTRALDTMNVDLQRYCERFFDGQIGVRLLPVKLQKTAAAKPVVSLEVTGPSGCYELASGGQDRGIDLAIHFSLRAFAKRAANGWSCNFLNGDEIFDQLDPEVTVRALEILKEEAPRVYLCTHSTALQALCDSVLHVRYEDEQTRL